MTKEQMWEQYIKSNPTDKTYDAWIFGGGDSSNALADLVMAGIKTATASAYQLYELEQSELPPVGGLNIILYTNGEAVCITKTTKVTVCKFSEVTESHAYLEGEGDRSLCYWRKVHEKFFTMELKEYGLSFDENMLVVCEEFEVVFNKN